MQNLVSVIVPIYNSEKYLQECINSIIAQTYKNIEILLINDGSTDKSVEICLDMLKKDKRIFFLSQNNGGVSRARNRGLQEAKGKYICFIDSDDLVAKNYIATLVKAMENSEKLDMVFDSHSYLFGQRVMKRKARLESKLYEKKEVISQIIDDGKLTGILFGSVCGAIYDNTFLKINHLQFNEEIQVNEDGLFNIQAIMVAVKLKVINEGNYYYRQENENPKKKMSVKEVEKRVEKLEACDKVIKDICIKNPDKSWEFQLRRRYVTENFWHILWMSQSSLAFWKLKKNTKDILRHLSIDMHEFDRTNMSRTKKIILYLMCKKYALVLAVILRYIYPYATKIIKR